MNIMYEWRNAKVDGNTRKAFELATDVMWRFDDEKARSAYVIFASLNIFDSAVSRIISDMKCLMVPDLDLILQDKEMFARIFGEETAERLFEEQEEEEKEERSGQNMTTEEQVENTVIEFLSDLIYGDEDDGSMQMLVPQYSDKLEQACDDAYFRCKAMGMDYISLDVIVYSLLQNTETSAYKFMEGILKGLDINIEQFMSSLRITANITSEAETVTRPVIIPASLETCVEILNNKYEKGEEITILGRDKEIYKAFNVFSKKTKRNAVLVGRPGVGKTAIIEAITQHIVNETCPKEFIGYTVLSLDVNSMVAGTKYRGEFETKVAVLKQFLEGTPKVILFVDEMHQMLGAGNTSDGGVDLSGSLKPVLSRDDVVFVGATTNDEYDRILSRDGAFKRRFEVITVKEPKHHEVKAMIEAKLRSMEKYHHVKLPRSLVDYIILCSTCFNTDNANPDKTLDLCDRSMAIAKMDKKSKVTKECINRVYEEYFEKYCNVSIGDLKATAYHEIGHYIVTRLTKESKTTKVVAVSVVPTERYVGVNILEETDTISPCDYEYVEAYLMSLLAGRVAQFRVSKAIDAGASNDLMVAKKFAKAVITQYGMDEGEFKNLYLMDDDLLNEKLTESINEKVKAMIDKAYQKTELFVAHHWGEIDAMAKYLLKKKIVTSEELDKFLKRE